jgi:hypothetical protein
MQTSTPPHEASAAMDLEATTDGAVMMVPENLLACSK